MLRRKASSFIIEGRRRQKVLCSYQRFQYIHAWSYITKWKKTVLLPLQALITEEILKHHIKDCFKVSGKKSLRKMNMLDLKIMEGKWKNYSWFKQNLKAL